MEILKEIAMLKKIRLELARNDEFPEGSSAHGYEFVAPLDRTGKIDEDKWGASRDKCRVVRFWGSDEHEHGHLVRRGGSGWAFSYTKAGDIDVDDETGYRFSDHTFRPGEYVSLSEHGEHPHTFRVARVTDLPK
jgi:hypothetical protein